jgi:hypothetical protein
LSRTIKEKIYKTFTNNNTTDWVNNLANVMDSYNTSPHLSIGNIAPINALKNIDDIREMNIQRNIQSNHGFKIGMLVRKRLAKSIFTKGYKQVWGKETFRIKDIKGVNAILDNDDKVKLNDLQEILEIETPIARESVVEKVDKEVKVARNIRKEGIDEADIIQVAAKRKPPAQTPKLAPQPKPEIKPKVNVPEFIVKAIHGTQKVKGTTFYITEWDGFPDKKDFTYEPQSNLKNNVILKEWKKQNTK